MGYKYVLSIVILTMNRKEQVLEALNSCLLSSMPEKTEYVIVDNHSNDGTGDAIQNFITVHSEISVKYQYQDANLGVGGGRSVGFDLAEGKYLYFLDDDAVISEESRHSFFTKPIDYLQKNKNVASITTRIKDVVLSYDRTVEKSKTKIDGRDIIFKYLGGSHFLRKDAFESPLYLPIQYGSEEFAPSIIAQDKGFYHVYFDDVYIIHKPKINKWIAGTDNMEYVLRSGFAVAHATKILLYPAICRPILQLAYWMRCYKYLRTYKNSIKNSNKLVRDIVKNNNCGKIQISTVIWLCKEFGLTVF